MPDVAALILAAGQASRYRDAGGQAPTKLVADWRGAPLVRWAVCASLSSRAHPVLVVTGHARAEVETALAKSEVAFVHNPDYAQGLSTSLRVGVAALPPDAAGVVVMLGDMPEASAAVVDALIGAFEATPGAVAAVALYNGRRGNPVLLGRALFGEVARLSGDEGARRLLQGLKSEEIVAVEVAEAGVVKDIDRPEDLLAIRDAEPRDHAAIVAAIAELQDYERRLSDTRLPGAEVAAAYFERLSAQAQAQGALLVAECEGAFAGFAVGWVEQDDEICETADSNRFGYVSDICVLEAFRGRRVSLALLAALEARLRRSGVTRLRLNFLAGNRSAQAAYERAGYAPYEVRYEKRIT